MREMLLRLDLRNAAFDDDGGPLEVARILRAYAGRIEDSATLSDAVLFDVNGNRCGNVDVRQGICEMGTWTYTTDKPAGAILAQELGGTIRMFTTDHESAAVAQIINLADLTPAGLAHVQRTYDLPDGAQSVTVCVVVKQTGLNGQGLRSVSLKPMGEECGPAYTGGANAHFLACLSPLREGAGGYAGQWRREVLETI